MSDLLKKAEELRRQAEALEATLNRDGRRVYYNNNNNSINSINNNEEEEEEDGLPSLKDKRILVIGANGRVGSMICRHLLRTCPSIKEVVAAVHTVSENSINNSNRGYSRLSYEVGAEDGIGTIGPAWSNSEERVASFEFDPKVMAEYNLSKLRLMEVELLDPIQCTTLTEDVDAVIFAATDFNGNRPRSISSLNMAFLFRAVASPDKGRVEVEGFRNILEGMTKNRISNNNDNNNNKKKNPTSVILLSSSPHAFKDFETPFGSFHGIKRQGEALLQEFPSLTHTVLQMNRYDDNFVDESLDLQVEAVVMDETTTTTSTTVEDNNDVDRQRRRIHRRDAARMTVDALTDETLQGKTVEVYTAIR